MFGSLKPNVRTLSNWKIVSAVALAASTVVSLTVGVVLYMTFWQATKSDIFEIYPQSYLIDVAKLFLCITMILTFPLPFFTCRELLVVAIVHPCCKEVRSDPDTTIVDHDMQPLLLPNNGDVGGRGEGAQELGSLLDTSSIASELSRMIVESASPKNWLLPSDDRQLQLVGHMILTAKIWGLATGLAIAAPSLGDVLDLVGCATGTIIAFILPALLSLRVEGFSFLAVLLLLVGGVVGTVGTYYSIWKLCLDF